MRVDPQSSGKIFRKPLRPSTRQTNQLLNIQVAQNRSRWVFWALSAGFAVLLLRAISVQVVGQAFFQKQADNRFTQTQQMLATRGKILDRNGAVLASSLPAKSVALYPDGFDPEPTQVTQLAALLGMKERELQTKISAAGSTYTYLKRQIDPAVGDQIQKMHIPGIEIKREYRRLYPGGEASAQIVGFTNIDDVGLEGVEYAYQKTLAGLPGSRRVVRNRLGHLIDEDTSAIRPPTAGRDLELAIDGKVQDIAFSAVKEAVIAHRAKAGAAVVLDVATGEVLALANWPTYNPNQRKGVAVSQMRNRALTDIFEPGSTMKPFTAALALELKKLKPTSVIQTAPGRLTIGTATIGDVHPHGALTLEQVIQKSSNVGTARIATEMLTREQMGEFYAQLGFGEAPKIGFPGAAAGRVRPYKTWKPIEQATMSYGHGIATSLIQMARAYTIFATDGLLLPVSITKTDAAPVGVQVLKPENALAVRKMLEMAAGPEGTAPLAQTIGYRVGGKTGTAYKQADGRYITNQYIASFVGIAPISNPRIVIAVMVDEPSAGKHFGGDVAAPVFAKIVTDALRILRVQPDAPYRTQIEMPSNPVLESI